MKKWHILVAALRAVAMDRRVQSAARLLLAALLGVLTEQVVRLGLLPPEAVAVVRHVLSVL